MKTIAVYGASAARPGEPDYEVSIAIGAALGQAGFAVMTGGYSGVMEAASRGAAEAGGRVIGITCAQIERVRPRPANPWLTEEVKYETLEERVHHLVEHADGYVVMPGGLGTMHELISVWELMRVRAIPGAPVVCYGAYWRTILSEFMRCTYMTEEYASLVRFAETPVEVVDLLQNHH